MDPLFLDWQATLAIYGQAACGDPVRIAQEDDDDEKATLSHQCTADLILSLDRYTFGRALDDNDFSSYRVWTLPDDPVIRCRFVYSCTPTEGGDEHEHEEVSCENGPVSVNISLVTPYPHSWPSSDKNWVSWLQQKATNTLLEQEQSYAVLSVLEHQAMDMWGNPACESVDGARFVLFRGSGPTFYNVDTYLVIVTAMPQEVGGGNHISKEKKKKNRREPDDKNEEEEEEDHDNVTLAYRLVRQKPNRRTEPCSVADVVQQQGPQQEDSGRRLLHPCVVQRDLWLPRTCKICYDTLLAQDMQTITCGHRFCRPCLVTYCTMLISEIGLYRHNPFSCPVRSCAKGMPIVGCVKAFLDPADMDKVRRWYKDLKNPPCPGLPHCLVCSKRIMRKTAVDSSIVYCEHCGKQWCEWCLARVYKDKPHCDEDCDATRCMAFCQRYLAASETARAACEAKWGDWIRVYARARVDNDDAEHWLRTVAGGQICPVCKNGIERSDGCFHIHCTCGAHFCYECGEEIHYPFYGTHHCWERKGRDD